MECRERKQIKRPIVYSGLLGETRMLFQIDYIKI